MRFSIECSNKHSPVTPSNTVQLLAHLLADGLDERALQPLPPGRQRRERPRDQVAVRGWGDALRPGPRSGGRPGARPLRARLRRLQESSPARDTHGPRDRRRKERLAQAQRRVESA